MREVVDIIVKTGSPRALDGILNQFGAALIQDGLGESYLTKDGGYVARCFADVVFIEFMIKNQGYGEVVKRLPSLV